MSVDVSDEVLVVWLKRGDMRALGELYLRYGDMVKRVLLRVAPEMGRADVDEVCQEVFLALNEGIERYQEQTKFKNWLYGIAIRQARAWRRKTWLRRKLLDTRKGDLETTALPFEGTHDSAVEHIDEALKALNALSSKQRDVVILSAVEGLTCEEIADVLGVRVGVVWSRLHRARRTLLKRREAVHSAHVYQGES